MNKVIEKLPKHYQKDIKTAIKILQNYEVTDIYLFGSLAKGTFNKHSDIDIAVKGLKPKYFFKVGGDLMMSLNNTIDLVDLDNKNSDFSKMLLKQGELVKVD